MIDTKTYVLIENAADRSRSERLTLPFSEDELEELLDRIGVSTDDDEDECDYDRLVDGKPLKPRYEIAGHRSDYLTDKHFDDIYAASDLVERIESLSDYDADMLRALIDDGEELEDAVEDIENGDVEFYRNTDLTGLAEQFVDEGFFDKDFLLQHIDFEAIGRELEIDGYTEIAGGVLRRG